MSATGFHPEPSAKAPWTRTIVLTAAYAGDDAAKAAPVRRARIKRFMVPLMLTLTRPAARVRTAEPPTSAMDSRRLMGISLAENQLLAVLVRTWSDSHVPHHARRSGAAMNSAFECSRYGRRP